MANVNDICRICANETGTLVAIYSQEGCMAAEKRLRSFKNFNPDPLSLDETSNHVSPYAERGDCNSEPEGSSRPNIFLTEENDDATSNNCVKSLHVNKKPVSCDTNEYPASYSCLICKSSFFTEQDYVKHSDTHKIGCPLEQIEKGDRKPKVSIKIRHSSEPIKEGHCEDISSDALETIQNPSTNAVPAVSTGGMKHHFSKDNSNEVSVIIDNTLYLNNCIKETDIQNNIESLKRVTKQLQEEQVVLSEIKEKKLLKEDIEELIDSVLKTCKLCDVSFEKKIDLNRHLLLQHNVRAQRIRKKYSEIKVAAFCDLCDKGFTRKYDMLKHRNTKHGESNLENNDEQEAASKSLNFIQKCRVKDGDGNVVYKCNDCGHVFKHSYNLIRHHTIHTGEKAYFCELCAKKFRTASGLNRHLTEFHYAIKKFGCEVCDKRFTTRASQQEHMNIHTDTRPYVCDVCGKAYRQKASLHVHKTYHGDVFRFTCSVCGNKYRRAQELKVHQRSHTGHKPFKCQVCEARYRLRQDLNRHALTHK